MKRLGNISSVSAFILFSMAGMAIAQNEAKNLPKPSEKSDPLACRNASPGAAIPGIVTMVVPNAIGPSSVAVTFVSDAFPDSPVLQVSKYKLDSDEGNAVYTGLMSALLSGLKVILVCDGNGYFDTVRISQPN